MLDTGERKNIDEARDVLVGKIPDPKAQVEQITIGMIYKFMDDIDLDAHKLGGDRKFFTGEFEKYAWNKLFDRQKSAHDVLNLYRDAIASMSRNPNIPPLFRQIFDKAFLSYNDPGTLKMFLEVINRFSYDNPENLGNAFEYLLSILSSQGDAGQFRTPRNIIEFMVDVTDPQKNDRILDPACGTGGFLIYAWRHILKYNSSNFNPEKDSCSYENSKADIKDHVINGAAYKGENLTFEDRQRLMNGLEGYDISPDMVRLALVNMYLHDIKNPKIAEYDTLTSDENWNQYFDCVFSNPPFMSPKGGIRPHGKFSVSSSRSEVLFVDYIMNHLSTRGKAAVIVPEGIIFQSQNAYKELRKELVENYLIAVVSLPAGVFNPYSGVKTSVLLLDRQLAKKTDGVLFVKVENDGYGLGAQRKAIAKNDLPKSAKAIKAYKAALNKGMEFNTEEFDNALLTPKSKIAENGEYNLSGERYKIKEEINHKWPVVKLSEVCDIKGGGTPSRNSSNYWDGKVKWISSKHINNEGVIVGWDYISELGLRNSSSVLIPKNSVLLVSRVSVGKYAYVEEEVAINQDLTALIPKSKSLNPRFLFYHASILSQIVNQSAEGVGVRGVTREFISNLTIPLPPLPMQEEIVAEIEGYQNIINGARQVVENWKPRIDIDPEWPMVELGEVCEHPQYGISKKLNEDKLGYKIFRMNDIIDGKMRDNGKMKFVDVSETEYLKFALHKNDILFNRTNSYELVGKTGIFKLEGNYCFASYLIRIICNNDIIIPDFLNIYINSNEFQNSIKLKAIRSIGQANINANTLCKEIIPLPPLSVQDEIVARIEEEQEIVNGNQRLIEIYEQKIKDRIAKVWGE